MKRVFRLILVVWLLSLGWTSVLAIAFNIPGCPEVRFPNCQGGTLKLQKDVRGCPTVICDSDPCPKLQAPQCNGTLRYKRDSEGCPEFFCEERSCPQATFPECSDGKITLERDGQGCETFVCDRSCPAVTFPPDCNGQIISEFDANGCQSLVCERDTCPEIPDLKTLGCGERRIISAIDANGCETFSCEEVRTCPKVVVPQCKGAVIWNRDQQRCSVPECDEEGPADPVVCESGDTPYCGKKIIECQEEDCPRTSQKTYQNLCELNDDGAIAVHRGGCYDDLPEDCSSEYQPVCGMINGNQTDYDNRCLLDRSGASFVKKGLCSGSGQAPDCAVYEPVCVRDSGGQERTMRNRCFADRYGLEVQSEGACGQNSTQICPEFYRPECGRESNGILKTYANGCLREAAGADLISMGRCHRVNEVYSEREARENAEVPFQDLAQQFPDCKRIYNGCRICIRRANGNISCPGGSGSCQNKQPAACIEPLETTPEEASEEEAAVGLKTFRDFLKASAFSRLHFLRDR